MSDTMANAEASGPLSQVQRVVDTFISPSKTFNDILRDSSWWLPWLLGALVTLGYSVAIQQKIGWDQTYANILQHSSEAQQERFAQLPPDQQARQKAVASSFTKYIVWASPVLGLLFTAIAAGLLLMTLNFGLGGHAKFGQLFAVWMYATLPWLIQAILGAIVLFAGLDADAFNLKNPVGTNLGSNTLKRAATKQGHCEVNLCAGVMCGGIPGRRQGTAERTATEAHAGVYTSLCLEKFIDCFWIRFRIASPSCRVFTGFVRRVSMGSRHIVHLLPTCNRSERSPGPSALGRSNATDPGRYRHPVRGR